MTVPQPIKVSYETLKNDPASARAQIEAGLGSGKGSLGIIVVSGEFADFVVGRLCCSMHGHGEQHGYRLKRPFDRT